MPQELHAQATVYRLKKNEAYMSQEQRIGEG